MKKSALTNSSGFSRGGLKNLEAAGLDLRKADCLAG